MSVVTAIVYSAGTYGTYLGWVLTTLTRNIPIVEPFTNKGNSHNFGFQSLLTADDTIIQDAAYKNTFVRHHPKHKKEDVISDNLNLLADKVNNILYLYPKHSDILLCINNQYSKIWDNWWVEQLQVDNEFRENLYTNWGISSNTSVNEIPMWCKREFLSFWLMPAWSDQVEMGTPVWSHIRSHTIFVNDLLYDFKNTILKIQKFCSLEFTKNIDDLNPSHNKMLSLQKHLTQDQLCNKIIDSIVNDQFYNWNYQELPLPSQSWIQWKLRNLGYELQCYGLNQFPTNSTQLRKLLTCNTTNEFL